MITGALIFFAGLVVGWFISPVRYAGKLNSEIKKLANTMYSKQATIVDMTEPLDIL